MDVLPFALEMQAIPVTLEGRPFGAKIPIVCCGCGQRLATDSILPRGQRGFPTLYPGYRMNGAGVYVRKRPPRGPYDTWDDETGKGIDYVFHLAVESDVTVICHRCKKRQIVRVR